MKRDSNEIGQKDTFDRFSNFRRVDGKKSPPERSKGKISLDTSASTAMGIQGIILCSLFVLSPLPHVEASATGLLPVLGNIMEPKHVSAYRGMKVAVDTVSA